MYQEWLKPKSFPKLAKNQIHIWKIKFSELLPQISCYWQNLTFSEKERANKFKVEHARNAFVISHGVLRKLLVGYLGGNPTDFSFQQNEYGKPSIENNLLNLRFNLSHSRDLALFAFALNYEVGVDVECAREKIEVDEIAAKFFAKAEVHDLFLLPPNERQIAFYNCWTRKEAFIKAIGKGIFFPLEKFSVAVDTKKQGRAKLTIMDESYASKPWVLYALDPAPEYYGALVVNCEKITLMRFC
ncbi:MAG: 4'-phosphopantetheinyl transferase superfamily protein [Gammaproteobacteria bacterium]|nr:4'-phosphopantetheinyl transferase superfamily protein [Gammaproteobacteria bacterium]